MSTVLDLSLPKGNESGKRSQEKDSSSVSTLSLVQATSSKDIFNQHTLEPSAKLTELRRMLYCGVCCYSTNRSSNLKRHTNSVHLKDEHVLKCCGKDYTSKTELRLHSLTVHKGLYKCPKCKKTFSQKTILERHLLSHADSGIKCDLCLYSSKNKKEYERHFNQHMKDERKNDINEWCSNQHDHNIHYKEVNKTQHQHYTSTGPPEGNRNDFYESDVHLFGSLSTRHHLTGGSCTASCTDSLSTGSQKNFGCKSQLNTARYSDFKDLPDMETISIHNDGIAATSVITEPLPAAFVLPYQHKKLRKKCRECTRKQLNEVRKSS
ncbi:hypothetical protein QYM36_005423 [Artemia franciscana]|uniref:C2H2-type domain-containing protein n=1 Tax=Artemia franciscana TaxID=6661 RepID=A0AA88I4D7_ARTSF|nr:hypothetical protein QYM36_005423 [Artemia franciscana]